MASILRWMGLIENVGPAGKVQEVKSDAYTNHVVVMRDGGLTLYNRPSVTDKNQLYEIVLEPGTNKSFGLYRAKARREVEQKYAAFVHRLPEFVLIAEEYYNVAGLQKVCDTLSKNPSWSLAHLSCYFNYKKKLYHEKIRQVIDVPDHQNNMTPLQLAIRSGHAEIVQELLGSQLCNIDHLDKQGWSVYHYVIGASKAKEIVNLLASKSVKNLNHFNLDGCTPLHLACLNNQPDCVKALILAGANVNISVRTRNKRTVNLQPLYSDFEQPLGTTDLTIIDDMKYGGTPLHWSPSRKVIESIIACGIDINVFNSDQQTALHIMVARNRLDCVIALLSHEAAIDLLNKDGNTALHIAVAKKFLPIVQCLIVFGGDINMLNQSGKTARHMVAEGSSESINDQILYILNSVGALRCPEENKIRCSPGCNANGTYNGKQFIKEDEPEAREHVAQVLTSSVQNSALSKSNLSNVGTLTIENSKKSSGRGRLLCLDGGGIRGLILAQMLVEIEKIAQTPIVHMFDWIAGTSTGGILALSLGCGKTIKESMCLYLRMKEQVFIGSRPYSSNILETVLKENLGASTFMTDMPEFPRIMVTTVLASQKPVDLHFFRSYKSAADILGLTPPPSNLNVIKVPSYKIALWEAALATSAAPTYFDSYAGCIDGGLIANNPTLDAITEIYEYNTALTNVGREQEVVPISIVVSLGTGLVPPTKLPEFRTGSKFEMLIGGVTTLLPLLVDQATASNGRVVERARAWCGMIGSRYFRFNPPISKDIDLDEKNDEQLINMMWETTAYMHANRNKVLELINLLK